jgi:serine/threonine-protein kinase ULK4
MPTREYQMSDYHTYEAIGKGKHSTVYKGRRKKSIQYFAMKSVEKGQRNRVMHEVQVMKAFSHENVLKFIACYETQNHLWLILEYCVGGDLLTLLSQDLKLPEPSIMTFARDMFVAARELHSKGLVHCDLKPSNMLLDEEGRIKICGFGLSRKVSTVVASSGTPTQLSRRGTPCYMAPEMFTQEGVHSYATDLWALGCVLYECATGRPPFTSTSLTSLIEQILEHEPAPLPAVYGTTFKNLVSGLLIKRPHARLTWDQVINHEFWTERGGQYLDDLGDLATLRLPPQPSFDALAAKLKSEDLAARLRMLGNARASGAVDVRDSFMPVLTQSLRDSVNVSRLSRIARSNLEREEVGSYAPSGAAAIEGDPLQVAAIHEDVELENPDAELNFTAPSGNDDLDVDMETEDVIIPSAPKTPPRGGRRGDDDYADENRAENFADPAESFGDEMQSDSDDATRIVLTPPTADAMLVDTRSPASTSRSLQTADDEFEETSSSMRRLAPLPAETPAVIGRTESRMPSLAARNDVLAKSVDYDKFKKLCTHSTDLTVRPIVSNHRIEVVKDAPHDPEKLPFKELSVDKMLATSQSELEAFLTRIYRSVAHPSNVQEKVNTLAYFETLCTEASSANVLANSSLMSMFVRVLGSSKSPPLKIKLCSIMGLLMRHATHISDEFAKSEAAKVLAGTMSDENSRVRRRAMAALGELSFYVATQQRPDASQVWGITDSVIEVFIKTLEEEEDEITKHYACKSIENIVSHEGSTWIQDAFAECRVVSVLFSIATNDAVDDQLRGTSASALARIVRLKSETLHPLVGEEDCDGSNARDGLVKMLRDRERKVQQAALNVLCRALVDEKSRLIATIMEVQTLLPILAGLYERSQTPIIKAKSLLAMALLIRAHPKWLQSLCKARVLPMLDRQPTQMDPYLQECFDTFVTTVVALVPVVNTGILQYVERSLSTGLSSENAMRPQAFELFPVLIHLLQSTVMRPKVLTSAFVIDIAKYIRAAEAEEDYPGRDELRVGVMALLETCAQCTNELIHKVDALTRHLLPALCDLLEGSAHVETRFLALKLIYELLLPLRLDLDIATQSGLDRKVVAHHLDQLLMQDLFPMCPALIDSEDPIPLYALKLLSGTLEIEPALCREIIALGLAPRFFEFLSLEHTNNNEHNIHLCLALARCKALSTQSLWDFDAPAKVAQVCAYSYERNVTQFVEPALGIAATLLRRAAADASCAAGDAVPSEIIPLLEVAPTLRRLAATIPDGALARDITHSLDTFNAH